MKVNDADDFRRTLAGVALISAPLAYGGSDVIRLSIEGRAAEGARPLAAIAASPVVASVIFPAAESGMLSGRRGASLPRVPELPVLEVFVKSWGGVLSDRPVARISLVAGLLLIVVGVVSGFAVINGFGWALVLASAVLGSFFDA